MTIAAMTSSAAGQRKTVFDVRAAIASPRPTCATAPNRAVISCSVSVATTEKAMAHSSVKPKLPPASVAVVTVPGPMKAAAIIAPGPKPFILFFIRARGRLREVIRSTSVARTCSCLKMCLTKNLFPVKALRIREGSGLNYWLSTQRS